MSMSKKMKNKVRKKSITWTLLLWKLDEGKFMPEFSKYRRQHLEVSANRCAYNFFKMKFGCSTTAIVRAAYRYLHFDEDVISTYYRDGRFVCLHHLTFNI